jgi:hypothetical protein
VPSLKSTLVLLLSLFISLLRNVSLALLGLLLWRKGDDFTKFPEPTRRAINVDDFLGKTRSYARSQLGLSYTSWRIDGHYCMMWGTNIPAVTAYFFNDKCVRMDTDDTWHLRAKDEAALLAQFSDPDRFVGMFIEKIKAIAGTPSDYGSFDFGDEVYEWQQKKVCVSVWCNSGTCISVGISRK